MPESDLEIYKAFRGQIEHESTLVGIRLGWLIAAEAFLAAAYATVLTVPGGHHQPENFVPQAKLVYTALPIAGIVLSACVGVSIWAALRAMGKLRKGYSETSSTTSLPAVTGLEDLLLRIVCALRGARFDDRRVELSPRCRATMSQSRLRLKDLAPGGAGFSVSMMVRPLRS